MECKHPKLILIENMIDGTYKCLKCEELFNVTLGPCKMPEPVFGVPKETKGQ